MSKQWKELSVLIAGSGSIGARHAGVLHSLGVGDLRVCDPRPDARDRIASQIPSVKLFDSYEAALEECPDTVFVCTPTPTHVPMAITAIEAGSHVMIEKPLSNSLDHVDELSALARSRRRKVMVALCFRYHDGVVKTHKYLRSGRIGRLISVRALMGEHLPEVRPDYRDLDCTVNTGAFELMHDLDLALWMADLPVKKVASVCGTYSDIGMRAPDIVEFLIDFDGPCVATVHLDLFQRPRRRCLELIGAAGVIILDCALWDECTVSLYEAAVGDWRHEKIPTRRDDMFRAEDRFFLEAVAGDLPIDCTIDEALKSLNVVLTAQEPGDRATEGIASS